MEVLGIHVLKDGDRFIITTVQPKLGKLRSMRVTREVAIDIFARFAKRLYRYKDWNPSNN